MIAVIHRFVIPFFFFEDDLLTQDAYSIFSTLQGLLWSLLMILGALPAKPNLQGRPEWVDVLPGLLIR